MNADLVQSSWAVARARQLSSDLSLQHPCDIEIEDIAFSKNIIVKDGILNGSEGRLVRMGNRGAQKISDGVSKAGIGVVYGLAS